MRNACFRKQLYRSHPLTIRLMRCPVNSSDSFFMFLHQIHIVVTHTVYMYN